MASERSLYRKIQVVLDEIRKSRPENLDLLAERIHERSPINFTYYNTRIKGQTAVEVCKSKTIRRTIDICVDLELISPDVELTPAGRKALNLADYDNVLRQNLKLAFKKQGIIIEKIESTILDILKDASPDKIPTWQSISDAMQIEARNKRKFHDHITLLGMCKGISFSQKKIYLPSQKR